MSVRHVTSEDFEEVTGLNLPVIIDFWAAWCGPCQMLGPIYEEVSNDYEGKLVFAKIDVESEQELASRFRVTGIPTMVIMHKGKEAARIVGMLPKGALKQKIDEVLSSLQ